MKFFSKEKPQEAWPEVPPSLNHDSVDLQDWRRDVPAHDTAGSITPYLGLRARLSQIPINRWTVLLLLVLARVLILLAGLNDDIGDAKTKALQACTKVEDIGSAMASMPHYLSVGVNEIAGIGITKSIHALVDILDMILTGVEQIILFVINMYIGTYICLSAALIHGALSIGVGAADDAVKLMNDAIGDITNGLSSDIQGIQNTINSAFSAIQSAANVFGQKVNPPTIDISGRINDLKTIKIDDTDFVKALDTLNNTIPTYAQAENLTKEAISIPFNMVKDLLNKTYGNYQFDTSIFPVADKQGLTFCSNNSKVNDFFDDLYGIAATAKIAFIVGLAVLAILACVPWAFIEIRRYRKQQERARIFTKHGYDPMDVVYIASRPMTATWGIKIASRFKGKRQLLVRWAIAYGTSLPALFVLSLAIAGLFSCFCQYLVLRAIQQEAPALAAEVGDFAGEVVTTLENVSEKWADDANGVILNFQNDLNDDLLGYVVNATTAVNDTLNTFTTEITKGITDVFGNTALGNTVIQLVACLVTNKVDMVEQGLTWVHDNAHVTLPLFPNDTFSAGADKSISGDSSLTSFLSTPASTTTDEIDGAVDEIITRLQNNIIQEALISAALLLVYIIVVLIGVVRSAAGMVTPDRTHGEGGQRFYTGDGRAPISPRRAPEDDAARFPAFEGSSESAIAEDSAARAAQDEKLSEAKLVKGGRGMRSPGHWRGSSYGQMEDVGR